MTDLTVNGEAVTITGRHASLLGALRDELRLTSPKDGCSPSGQCGCCTVLIDGKARVSCQTPVEKLAGASVTTLEGLDPVEVGAMADAFAACGALQCGFCTPGIVVRTKSLLDKKGADLTRDDAARHLDALGQVLHRVEHLGVAGAAAEVATQVAGRGVAVER